MNEQCLNIPLSQLARTYPPDYCLLCGGSPAFTGVFIPDDPINWGGPEGKTRFVLYQICKDCFGSKGLQEKVEKVIKHELTK